MSAATTRAARISAVWDTVESELDELADRAATRIAGQMSIYGELPAGVLVAALRANFARGLEVLRSQAPPSSETVQDFVEAATDRALQGFPLQDVLRAYRIGLGVMWERLSPLVTRHDLHAADVLSVASTLRSWEDAVTDAVADAHSGVGIQLAREDQQRRDTFLRALVAGALQGEDLRRASEGFGLDPEQTYVPARIRAVPGGWPHGLTHRVEQALGGRPGVVGQVDRDVVSIALVAPDPVPDTTVAVGPPAELALLQASFAVATRALQTGSAFGMTGLVDLGSLSIRPAVLTDAALGALFEARRLAPLEELGALGVELEGTLRRWFELGMRHEETARDLHLHPNTLRHRLRRYEEVTGSSLRDITTLTELHWALERRTLGARA